MSGAANYDVSAQGTLAYVTGVTGDAFAQLRSLVWVNRQGREEPLDAPPRSYASPRLSPDGTRVALDIRDLNNDIWILDLAGKLLTPLNVDPAIDMSPCGPPMESGSSGHPAAVAATPICTGRPPTVREPERSPPM